MKIKTEKAIAAYRILTDAKIDKLTDTEKVAAVRLICRLRPVAEAYDTDLQEAVKRLRPAGLDEIIRKEQAGVERTPEELKAVADFNAAVAKVVEEQLARDTEIPDTGLTDESVARLAASNPGMTLGQTLLLCETLCGQAGGADESPKTDEPCL